MMAATMAVAGLSNTACKDEPDKYEIADGLPSISYVRLTDPAASDSLLAGQYMSATVCLVGNNLRSVYELYFNDQKAILNTSYMTDNTIIVSVPKTIPSVVTDKIYMVTQNKDTVDYGFKVLVPAPEVSSMSCEFAAPGKDVTLYGDYFIDDPNVPLTISMAGNVNVPRSAIKDIQKTSVTFTLPNEAVEGYLTVKSIYGVGRSKFQYRDTRNILFDWDGSHGGLTMGHGWRDGSKVLKAADENSIDGAYIQFAGDLEGEIGATWAEDPFSFNYWPDEADLATYPELSSFPAFASMIEEYGVENLQLKFEVMIPASNPWQSCALQAIFSGNDVVTYATGSNAYFSDTSVPRGLWMPWRSTGSYDTAGQWQTISMPLATFNKTHDGAACANALGKDDLTGLTFFVWNGGVAGTTCSPIINIDNIRVVPVE